MQTDHTTLTTPNQHYKNPMWNQTKQNNSPISSDDNTRLLHSSSVLPKLSAVQWEDEDTYCYQVEANNMTVARRKDNAMINGTKLLNVVGMTRGKRDGILKAEKGRHVIKSGSMVLKGVWIPLERAQEMAKIFKIDELLYPLFETDIEKFYYDPMLSFQAHSIDIEISSQGLNKMLEYQRETFERIVDSKDQLAYERIVDPKDPLNDYKTTSHIKQGEYELNQAVPERNSPRSMSYDLKTQNLTLMSQSYTTIPMTQSYTPVSMSQQSYTSSPMSQQPYVPNSLPWEPYKSTSMPQPSVTQGYRENTGPARRRRRAPTNLPPISKPVEFHQSPTAPLQSPASYSEALEYEYGMYPSQAISMGVPFPTVPYAGSICDTSLNNPITQSFYGEQIPVYSSTVEQQYQVSPGYSHPSEYPKNHYRQFNQFPNSCEIPYSYQNYTNGAGGGDYCEYPMTRSTPVSSNAQVGYPELKFKHYG